MIDAIIKVLSRPRTAQEIEDGKPLTFYDSMVFTNAYVARMREQAVVPNTMSSAQIDAFKARYITWYEWTGARYAPTPNPEPTKDTIEACCHSDPVRGGWNDGLPMHMRDD